EQRCPLRLGEEAPDRHLLEKLDRLEDQDGDDTEGGEHGKRAAREEHGADEVLPHALRAKAHQRLTAAEGGNPGSRLRLGRAFPASVQGRTSHGDRLDLHDLPYFTPSRLRSSAIVTPTCEPLPPNSE